MSTNDGNLPSRAREWFGRLGRAQKVLAASATLVITVGGVASGVTAVLDLGDRLGATGPAPNGDTATAHPATEGALVTEVIPGSPADRAGLEVGDVITDVGGESVEDVDDLRKALGEVDDGESVLVSVARGPERESVLVKPGPIEGTSRSVGIEAEDALPEDGAFRKARSDDGPAARATPPPEGSAREFKGATPASSEPSETKRSAYPSTDQYSAEE